VPGLTRGKAPEIDLALLERELGALLDTVTSDGWLERNAPEGARRVNDVAFSGNGEPTSSPQFEAAVRLAARALAERGLVGAVKLVLITNGSLIQRAPVQRALAVLAEHGGEVWFKLDSATDAGMRAINDARPGMERVRANLRISCGHAPTWIQTCVFARNGEPPAESELSALLELLREHAAEGRPPRGVLLYGLARPSHQPEAPVLERLPARWLEQLAARIEAVGLSVRVHP
jgi:wyosine [tRNA(Phe)-imidazoG37] synthetase (radical SAM superfamily)